MAIPTRASLNGVIVSDPRLTIIGTGPARFYARVEVYPSSGTDSSAIQREPAMHELVMFGPAAERAYAIFRAGDSFVAPGYVDAYEYDGEGLVEEFVAEHLGHDSGRTPYRVDRRATRRPPLAQRERPSGQVPPGIDL